MPAPQSASFLQAKVLNATPRALWTAQRPYHLLNYNHMLPYLTCYGDPTNLQNSETNRSHRNLSDLPKKNRYLMHYYVTGFVDNDRD